ncbi:hypothetical protein WICMUC_005908 [Wickerhamomyces mucosus]|uniref:RNA helicase n=1 Tax=Wickerhamomyces mucosus TaxID=1378264 RepID=A0A9P8T2S3_9ASCO|nr:hypothetical protein WICMUC_005908 [Wickerhamomyces mucosus]
MLRTIIHNNIRIRYFHSSVSAGKKALPFKRLVVDRASRLPDEKKKPNISTQTVHNKTGKSINQKSKSTNESSESHLPVLESFTKQELKKSENLVNKITEFSELKLLPEVRNIVVNQIKNQTVLRAQNYEKPKYEDPEDIKIKPSPVQVVSIHTLSKHIMESNMKTYTIAAETGSGKTWAYLAPLLDYLKQQEEALAGNWERISKKSMIRSVIMVPTLELVNQVHANVKDLENSIGIKSFKWDTDTQYSEFIDAFKNRIDILVTTPGKINSIKNIRMISRPEHILANVKFLVIDEADTLMDRSFVESTYEAITKMHNVNRLVFCSATISNQFNKAITKIFPQSEPELIISPILHKTPKSIKFKLIDSEIAPYQGSRIKALAQILYAINKDGTEANYEKRCVVFVNNKTEVVKVAETLKELYNHDVVTLTGDDNPQERSEKIKVFINPPKPLEENSDGTPSKKKEHYTRIANSNIKFKTHLEPTSTTETKLKVLVTTDIAARGLNFFGVRNVILYDTPSTPVDFLHRIGRTGRMNQSGRVFIITDRKTKPWVKRIAKGGRNKD